jgi:hypothetical protein
MTGLGKDSTRRSCVPGTHEMLHGLGRSCLHVALQGNNGWFPPVPPVRMESRLLLDQNERQACVMSGQRPACPNCSNGDFPLGGRSWWKWRIIYDASKI